MSDAVDQARQIVARVQANRVTTLRNAWFGRDLGKQYQRDWMKVDTPTGALCDYGQCGLAIEADDDGIVMPILTLAGHLGNVVMHRDCWMRSVGVGHDCANGDCNEWRHQPNRKPRILPVELANRKCHIGQRKRCCRYLLAGGDGFECAASGWPSAMEQRPILDRRVADGAFTATAAGCDDPWDDESEAKPI